MDKYILKKIINISFTSSILLSFFDSAYAMDWTVHPSLQVQEIYSDNITLSNSNKKAAFVTDISPGISVNGTSTVNSFDLNYRMQNLYNAGGNSGLDIKNQLQMNSKYEFVRNKLFMDSSSSISQQNISNRQTSTNNNSGGGNSTNVTTFKLSPYWTPHFNSYANGDFRVTYDTVSTDRSGANGKIDTSSYTQNYSLSSGKRFSYFNWILSYNHSFKDNTNGNDITFQDSSLDLSYALNRDFSIFTIIGQSSNSFSSNSNSSNNGVSYTFGGQWKPSQRFLLKAGYGNNAFVTVDILPFDRLRWVTTYSNNNIGLNIGDTLDTRLDYRTRRSIWSFTFNEQTSTTQQQLLNQQVFTTTNSFNQQQQNILQNQGVRFNNQLPSLTNEVFVTKTAKLAVSFRTGKSNVSADAFFTRRNFEVSKIKEELTGFSASWKWNFSQRTNTSIRTSWQKIKSDGSLLLGITPFSDKRFDVTVGLTRNILSHLSGSIQYRFIDQSSNNSSNRYTVNSVSASLILQF